MPEDSLPLPLRDGDIRIREACSSDIDDLVRLEELAFASDRLSRRRFAAFAKGPTASLLVAHRGGALAGYALVLIRKGSSAARLYSLAVHPELAGRGLGASLLALAEAAALERGAKAMRLEVRSDNEAAIRLYKQRGYRPISRREEYYADGMPALCYVRSLHCNPASRSTPLLDQAA